MSRKPIVRRLRVSSEFTCSRCGGREAYSCQEQSTFERYLLNAVMVRRIRCCDCDGLCYAFPVRLDGPVLAGTERTALVARAA
jgi:transcription elongation factor Elf1